MKLKKLLLTDDALSQKAENVLYRKITWAELKALRDNGALVEGVAYRITDYRCTTTQFGTQSADHQFDIIVVADDANTLNENARAVLHDGDTYFANSKLSAWEIKYCLDNDNKRFKWADKDNGKGVIYYMKDEFGNECHYDFKNIQFKRYKVESSPNTPSLMGGYYGIENDFGSVRTPHAAMLEEKFFWCYTFCGGTASSPEDIDLSLEGLANSVYANSIGYCKKLNNIVFFGIYCHSNTFGNNCHSNTFGNNCHSNAFGNDCHSNAFGNDCHSNAFGNECWYNCFGIYCYSNTFGNELRLNSFGNRCLYNAFGNRCLYNIFGNSCYCNSFGNLCCSNVLLGNADDSESEASATCNVFGNGVAYARLVSSTAGLKSDCLCNVHVHSGVTGTLAKNKIITAPYNMEHSIDYYAPNSEVIILD